MSRRKQCRGYIRRYDGRYRGEFQFFLKLKTIVRIYLLNNNARDSLSCLTILHCLVEYAYRSMLWGWKLFWGNLWRTTGLWILLQMFSRGNDCRTKGTQDCSCKGEGVSPVSPNHVLQHWRASAASVILHLGRTFIKYVHDQCVL